MHIIRIHVAGILRTDPEFDRGKRFVGRDRERPRQRIRMRAYVNPRPAIVALLHFVRTKAGAVEAPNASVIPVPGRSTVSAVGIVKAEGGAID